MNNYFEIKYFKRIARTNYVLITLYLAISLTAHVIANRLVLFDGIPIISAGFIYMGVFVLTDVFATYNPRKLVYLIICLEAFFNLFFILYVSIIVQMPAPNYFPTSSAIAYKTVFSPILILYIANLGGTFISAIVDLSLFYWFYKKLKWYFLSASFTSSIITISVYTWITDYFGFRGTYPNHVIELTAYNLLTNFITLLIYSIIGQILVIGIFKYLNRK